MKNKIKIKNTLSKEYILFYRDLRLREVDAITTVMHQFGTSKTSTILTHSLT